MGQPVEAVFCDREAFADFFTRYYTDFEPEHCLVAEAEDGIVGYLICCVNSRLYAWRQAQIMAATAPRVARRILTGRYDARSLRFLVWFITRAFAETPKAPENSAHFHLNILSEWRNGKVLRALFASSIKGMREWGAKRIYGQIQLYDDRRPLKVFERFGFRKYDQRRVSKFDHMGRSGVYVTTLVYDIA
jgi:hypothetical protein